MLFGWTTASPLHWLAIFIEIIAGNARFMGATVVDKDAILLIFGNYIVADQRLGPASAEDTAAAVLRDHIVIYRRTRPPDAFKENTGPSVAVNDVVGDIRKREQRMDTGPLLPQ